MARYAADRRRIVQSELSRAWEYFDPEEYAERVLSAMPPGGHIYVPSSAQLAALGNASPAAELEINLTGTTDLTPIVAHAASLRGLSLYYDEPGADPAALPALPKLDSLALGLPGLADLHFLDALPQLEMIWLTNCWDIEDYSPLLRFTRLRTLTMFSSHQLRSLVQLPPLEAVRTLSLDRSGLGRGALEGLVSAAPHITNLYLGSCAWLDDLRPLGRAETWGPADPRKFRRERPPSAQRTDQPVIPRRVTDSHQRPNSPGRALQSEDPAANRLRFSIRPTSSRLPLEPQRATHRGDHGRNRPVSAGWEPEGDRIHRGQTRSAWR